MHKPPFEIDHDARRQLLTLRLVGLWDRAILDDYTAALNSIFSKVEASGRSTSGYRVLVDLREHGLQPRDIAAEIEARLSRGAAQASRHAILVSGSVLHRMQVKRAGAQIEAYIFVDEAEAMQWLLTETRPNAAPPDV